MDKYLNNYNSIAAYEGDSARKALQSSTVSKVNDDIIRDGINAETGVPALGDAVYHDENNQVHFIRCDTVDAAKIPAGWTAVGVCGVRWKGKIFIISGRHQSQRFAQFYRWKVTGWTLDGSAHTCNVTLHNQSCAAFTYQATALEQCQQQLDAYLKANHPADYQYNAYIEEGEIYLQLCNYDAYQGDNNTISGLSIQYATATELEGLGGAYIHDYPMRCYPVWNEGRALEYFHNDNSNSAYNPTSVVSSLPNYPVCLPGYLGTSVHRDGDKCAWLRERYGEGEQGWRNYIHTIAPLLPFTRGMCGENYGDGHTNTYLLAHHLVPALDGTPTGLYPIADYAANIGFAGVKGLEKGDWFAPSPAEFMANFGQITYGLSGISASQADPINRTLNAMGLDTISCSANSWLLARYYSYYSWIAYHIGYTDGYYFYYRFRVLPVALYAL